MTAAHYPGHTGPVPDNSYVITILQAVIEDLQGLPSAHRVKANTAQIRKRSHATKAQTSYHFLQCMPHFDTSKPYHLLCTLF